MKLLIVLLLAAAVSADVREAIRNQRQAVIFNPGSIGVQLQRPQLQQLQRLQVVAQPLLVQQPFQTLQQPAIQQFQTLQQPDIQQYQNLQQPAFQPIPQPNFQPIQDIPRPNFQPIQAIPQPNFQPIQAIPQPAVRQFQTTQSQQEPNWRILKQTQKQDPNGPYSYSYETENGIRAEEEGVLIRASGNEAAVAAQGSYSYTAPDGTPISVRYVADENGFRADGDHLPTPPPIPAEILASLEQNAREEAQEGGFRN